MRRAAAALLSAALLGPLGAPDPVAAAPAAASPTPAPPVLSPTAPPVRLGAVLSLSGAYAAVGEQERVALQVALAAANRTGGVGGRRVALHVVDDRSSPAGAAAATRALLADRPAAIVGGSYAATCAAMRPLTERARIVQYCLSGAPTGRGGTFFSSFPSAGRTFGDLPATFAARAGYRAIGVVVGDDRAGRLYARAILSASAARRLRTVGAERFSGPGDVEAAVDRVLARRPDLLYVGAAAGGAESVLRALRARGSRVAVWLVSADATRATARALAPALPAGPVFSATTKLALFERLPANDPQRALLVAFSRGFAEAAHGAEPDVFAVIAADAAEFLVAALRADGGVGGETLARTLERTPRTPALYAWYRFGPDRHDGTELPGVVVRFGADGLLEPVETIEDADVPATARVGAP